MKTIAELMAMPWTWLGPRKVSEDGNTFWEARVGELPGFFVAAASLEELETEADDALRSHLLSYVEAGEEPPLPTWSYRVLRSGMATEPTVSPMLPRKVAAG